MTRALLALSLVMTVPAFAAPPPPKDFQCPRCEKRHAWKEQGFAWPDATFALTVPAEEQAKLRTGENEDVLVVRDTLFFIRAWAAIPIKGGGTWGIGFWAQVSKEDFADFEKHQRVKHPTYQARLANQAFFLGPTLGMKVLLSSRGKGLRPTLTLVDEQHPLTRAQREGVALDTVRKWMAEGHHPAEPEALGQPFTGTLEAHGWTLVAPERAGKKPLSFTAPPRVGDMLKLIFTFVGADENGAPTQLNAGWWVRVDDVSRKDLWSGTLRNEPRVPATLLLGSRVWFSPQHVIDFESKESAEAR